MTQSTSKTVWVDSEGEVWDTEPNTEDDTKYGPFTECALVPVTTYTYVLVPVTTYTCTSVLDAAGFEALGVGAVVAQEVFPARLKFTLEANGEWRPNESDWDYTNDLLADLDDGVPLLVLDPGAPVSLSEPQEYGARVEVDGWTDSTQRVIVYRLEASPRGPWVELDYADGEQQYRVWSWPHLTRRNPSLTD